MDKTKVKKPDEKRASEMRIAESLLHCSGSYTAVSCEGCPREGMYSDPIDCMESMMRMAADIICREGGEENGCSVQAMPQSPDKLSCGL